MQPNDKQNTTPPSDTQESESSSKLLTVIGAILCVIFGIMLIFNLTIIVKGTANPDQPPSVFGVMPLVVLSGSMSGDAPDHIEVGDLIFIKDVDPDDLVEENIITFREGKSLVTHRIIGINGPDENGKRTFNTKGDANNLADLNPIEEEDIVGVYVGRLPVVGDIALFMQTPIGMVLFIGVPLAAYIVYDVIRRKRYANAESAKNAKLEEELSLLRDLAAKQEAERAAKAALDRTAELEAELARLRALTSQSESTQAPTDKSDKE